MGSGMMINRRFILAASLNVSSFAFFGCARATGAGKFDWSRFKSAFLQPDGRILDTGNGGISHSEGQGFGLILSQAAGDREAFRRIWSWTDANLRRQGDSLFAWRFDPASHPPVSDHNNATDGDILIAWALLRAGKAWGDASYLAASQTIRASILRLLVKSFGKRVVLLPGASGFDFRDHVLVNPSYYAWPALDEFDGEDSHTIWGDVINQGLELIRQASFGPYGLTTDWVEISPSGSLAPARGHEPRFGFDAIRAPLYLAWTSRTNLLQTYRKYFGEHFSQEAIIPAWLDVKTGASAGYPLSIGGVEAARFVCDLPPDPAKASNQDYYSSALEHLARLARNETENPIARLFQLR